MKINQFHLYFSSPVPEEDCIDSLLQQMQSFIPSVKEKIGRHAPMQVGLTLSDHSCQMLLEGKNLSLFREWLMGNDMQVTSLDGFHYLSVHKCRTKDDYYKPDWNTQERVEYTKRLSRILTVLLPAGYEGCITTSSLVIPNWYADNPASIKTILKSCAHHLTTVVEDLLHIRKESGKTLSLNIEMSPFSMLETTRDIIDFYEKYLLPVGVQQLFTNLKISPTMAEEALRAHVRICINTAHSLLIKENIQHLITGLNVSGIKIGKVKLASPVKTKFSGDDEHDRQVMEWLYKLDEKSCYYSVHNNDSKTSYRYSTIEEMWESRGRGTEEITVYFSAPLYDKKWMMFHTCQDEVRSILSYLMESNCGSILEMGNYNYKLKMDAGEYADNVVRDFNWLTQQVETKTAVRNDFYD